MRKTLPIAFLALACGLVPARPAGAQSGVIRWIEKLSGPGDFVGAGYEFFPLCYGTKSGFTRENGNQVVKEQVDDTAFGADLNCRAYKRDGRLVIIGGQAAYLWGNNNQTYAPSVPSSFTKRVEALLFMGTVDAGLHHPAFAVGAGAGFMRFYGMPAPAFNHPIYNFRLTIKPLQFKQINLSSAQNADAYRLAVFQRYRDDWIQARLDFDILPGGLEDTDFGALPGTFEETSTELSVRVSVAFNLGNAFKW